MSKQKSVSADKNIVRLPTRKNLARAIYETGEPYLVLRLMQNGTRHWYVSGYSNQLGTNIQLWLGEIGQVSKTQVKTLARQFAGKGFIDAHEYLALMRSKTILDSANRPRQILICEKSSSEPCRVFEFLARIKPT